MTGLTSACDKAEQVKPGQTESEVRAVLGTPSFVVTDARFIPERFVRDENRKQCVPQLKQVWVYERWLRQTVTVGFDARVVRCVERLDLTSTTR